MDYKEITKGEKIAALGLGTWRIGGGEIPDLSKDREEIKTLQYGIEKGMTHIDTAEYYGAGHSEEIVCRAIEPFNRKDLFITTKVWPNHLKYHQVLKSIKASLKRLEVDYVDLFLIHWPNPDVPLSETMKALENCVEDGYTRYIGVSNFSAKLMMKAQSHLKENRLVANQVKYNLNSQEPKEQLLPYCIENNAILVAYSPLGKGNLTRPFNKVLDNFTTKYDKTRAQIALNWLISQENVITIPKASNIQHLKENLGSVGWTLSSEDRERLSQSFIESAVNFPSI